jgi:hypothetical protein
MSRPKPKAASTAASSWSLGTARGPYRSPHISRSCWSHTGRSSPCPSARGWVVKRRSHRPVSHTLGGTSTRHACGTSIRPRPTAPPSPMASAARPFPPTSCGGERAVPGPLRTIDGLTPSGGATCALALSRGCFRLGARAWSPRLYPLAGRRLRGWIVVAHVGVIAMLGVGPERKAAVPGNRFPRSAPSNEVSNGVPEFNSALSVASQCPQASRLPTDRRSSSYGDPEGPDPRTGEPVTRLDDPGLPPVIAPWPLLALGNREPRPGLGWPAGDHRPNRRDGTPGASRTLIRGRPPCCGRAPPPAGAWSRQAWVMRPRAPPRERGARSSPAGKTHPRSLRASASPVPRCAPAWQGTPIPPGWEALGKYGCSAKRGQKSCRHGPGHPPG